MASHFVIYKILFCGHPFFFLPNLASLTSSKYGLRDRVQASHAICSSVWSICVMLYYTMETKNIRCNVKHKARVMWHMCKSCRSEAVLRTSEVAVRRLGFLLSIGNLLLDDACEMRSSLLESIGKIRTGQFSDKCIKETFYFDA